jgi:hypothetical protein
MTRRPLNLYLWTFSIVFLVSCGILTYEQRDKEKTSAVNVTPSGLPIDAPLINSPMPLPTFTALPTFPQPPTTPLLPTPTLFPTSQPITAPWPTPSKSFPLDRYLVIFIKDGILYFQDGIEMPVELIHIGGSTPVPILSDDNQKVVFFRQDEGNINSINVDGSHERTLITNRLLPEFLNQENAQDLYLAHICYYLIPTSASRKNRDRSAQLDFRVSTRTQEKSRSLWHPANPVSTTMMVISRCHLTGK